MNHREMTGCLGVLLKAVDSPHGHLSRESATETQNAPVQQNLRGSRGMQSRDFENSLVGFWQLVSAAVSRLLACSGQSFFSKHFLSKRGETHVHGWAIVPYQRYLAQPMPHHASVYSPRRVTSSK